MKRLAQTPISYEFFPPKTPEGEANLQNVAKALSVWKPSFYSVTFGAGGSTQQGSLRTVERLIEAGFDAAPHLSCIGATSETLREQISHYQRIGVKRIVALRGDLPSGYGSMGEFRYASDLVSFIRAETGNAFHIEVACYPETHPQASSPRSDIEAYVTKVKSGANSAITQYFFNADAYFRFVDEAYAAGADVPVIPGIMPILGSTQLMRFSDACGAEIPRWIRMRLQAFGDDTASIKAFGHDVVTDLCEQLITAGVPGLHFFTMNQVAPVNGILTSLQERLA
ncbi:MAG: methylenetetrahydrofolate reductase [Pseudomonadota bacterium]